MNSKLVSVVGSLMGVTALAGCGTNDDDTSPELGKLEAAIGEAGCTTIAAGRTDDFWIDFTTPSSYGSASCEKAFVLDLQADATDEQGEVEWSIVWASPPPPNAIACNGAKVRADLYRKDANGTYGLLSSEQQQGFWLPNATCELPGAWAYTTFAGETDLRLVVQALSSFGATRQVKVATAYLSVGPL
jgi:hypothetical protein